MASSIGGLLALRSGRRDAGGLDEVFHQRGDERCGCPGAERLPAVTAAPRSRMNCSGSKPSPWPGDGQGRYAWPASRGRGTRLCQMSRGRRGRAGSRSPRTPAHPVAAWGELVRIALASAGRGWPSVHLGTAGRRLAADRRRVQQRLRPPGSCLPRTRRSPRRLRTGRCRRRGRWRGSSRSAGTRRGSVTTSPAGRPSAVRWGSKIATGPIRWRARRLAVQVVRLEPRSRPPRRGADDRADQDLRDLLLRGGLITRMEVLDRRPPRRRLSSCRAGSRHPRAVDRSGRAEVPGPA